MKIKSRDIIKPSAAVYESTDGPLIRVTLKCALELFQTKIAEISQSTDNALFIDQVMITHLYWSSTDELVKCFANAIKKAQVDHAADNVLLSRVCLKVCQNFKTFLTYFDVSSCKGPLAELQAAISAAYPQLAEPLMTWISNNEEAFVKTSWQEKIAEVDNIVVAGHANLSGSTSGSQKSSTATQSASVLRLADTLAGSDSESTSSRASPVRASTPARDARIRAGSNGGGMEMKDAITHSAPLPRDRDRDREREAGRSPPARMRTANTSAGSSEHSSSSATPHTASTAPAAAISSLSLTNTELPDPEILANQMALADWTVFSKCTISDFMNAAYLPKNKPSAPAAAGEPAKAPTPPANPAVHNTVARYIEHTNMTTRWIATKILGGASSRSRGKMLSYFVRLMELLKERGDYTGMINVFTTLNTNSIWKLRKSWKYVDSKRTKSFMRFEAVIKPMANFAGYRDLLAKSSPPAVPALAILTKDLVAIEEQPTYVEDDDGNPTQHLNWVKFAQLAAVLSEQFIRLAKSGYSVPPLAGLFEELVHPDSIEVRAPRDAREAAIGTVPSGTVIPFLLSETEISDIADQIDMEEQGLAQPPTAPVTEKSPTLSHHTVPTQPAAGPKGTLAKKPSALSLYLQFATMGSSPPGSTPSLQRSASPPPAQLSASVAQARERMQSSFLPPEGAFLSLLSGLDHVASVVILRRVLTNALYTSHLVSESFNDTQRKSFENQHVLSHRDSLIRILRLIDLSVDRATMVIGGRWRAMCESGSTGPETRREAPSMATMRGSKTPDRTGSLSSISDSGSSKGPDYQPGDPIREIEDLELANPHTHLTEVLAETVRIFQKFDGVTKFRNMIRVAQLQSATGIGQSLLLENRGVLAEMSLASRALINAFIAATGHYFTVVAPTLGTVPVSTNNLCFGCSAQIDRVSISLQLSVTNNESYLPKGLLALPPGEGGNRMVVPRLLAQLPSALAELLLPFEAIISTTSASISWFSKIPEPGAISGKKEKAISPPATSRGVPLEDENFIGYAAGASSQEGVCVLGVLLPLGSYASTLTYVSPSQKRYLASKLTSLVVAQWKVEHVVTWLYLTGMSAWCSKFEQQSISGAELSDLDQSDLDDMGVRPHASQSAAQLLKNLRSLVKSSLWDGVIAGESNSQFTEYQSQQFSIPGYLTASSSSSSLADLPTGNSDDSEPDAVYQDDTSESSETSSRNDDPASSYSAKLRRKMRQDSDILGRSASPGTSRRSVFSGSSPTSPIATSFISSSPGPSEVRKKRRSSSSRQSPATSPPAGSPMSASSLGGSITPSRRSPKASLARLRVLEGMHSGIIVFPNQAEFTLQTFLAKANQLFKPQTPYTEDVDIAYYDSNGDVLNISGQLSFNRLSDHVWQELIADGSIDAVYASINPPQDGLSSPTAASIGLSYSSLPHQGKASSTSSSFASLPEIPVVAKIEYPVKYNDINASQPLFVLEESSGSIIWSTEACKTQIANETFVGRNLDHFTPESMFELMKKIKADPSAANLATVLAGESGILNARLRLTPLPGTLPAAWECIIEIDSAIDSVRSIEMPKLRDVAAKTNACVLCFSQQYGLVQFANRKMLQLVGTESLQGAKIATILPFGAPTTPGPHSSVPIQKKDGSLAVANFVLRQYSTGSDSLVILSSPSS
jgi:hypothetical protein